MYRYLLGTYDDRGGDIEPFFRFDSPDQVEHEDVLNSLRTALEQAGFTCLPKSGLSVKESQVHIFRKEEVDLPLKVANVDQALDQIGSNEVLVVACRSQHSSGTDGEHRLLAIPKGSTLPRRADWRHDDAFDKDVNWMFGEDLSWEPMTLPQGTQIWDGSHWIPISMLDYCVQ